LISAPILGYANFELPFEIHTDASGTALGAVLYQEQDGFKKVISYAKSRREVQSLHSRVLELISIVASVSQMLYPVHLPLPDNNPMTYVLTTAKLDATGHRWLAALAAFNFNILYRPGLLGTIRHLPNEGD
jgi:hypothetical protein